MLRCKLDFYPQEDIPCKIFVPDVKNIAVVFITRQENGQNVNEGSNEMMSAPDGDDEEDGKTATFPFLGRLFRRAERATRPRLRTARADFGPRAERGKKNDKAAKHKIS